jgi:hypothetical protein
MDCTVCHGTGEELGSRCTWCGGEGIEPPEDAGEEHETIEAQLAKQGLRLAKDGEAGWYVMVTDHDEDGSYGTKVWATDLPPSHGAQNEGTEFDKFMDRIVITERRTKKVDVLEENNPQRQRAMKYQDRPLNKTRFGGKR